MEKRKEVRLSLHNVVFECDNTHYPVDNVSLSGIRIKKQFPLNANLLGVLIMGDKKIPLNIKVVNSVSNFSGCLILNTEEVKPFLEPWFNPHNLISKLKPEKGFQGLFYEDHNHNCWFKFFFDDSKKINKILVTIHNDEILWDNNKWTSVSAGIQDAQLDLNKIKLLRDMVVGTRAFPQSFKDWFLDIIDFK